MIKRLPRTKLSNLNGATTIAERELEQIGGAVMRETKSCMTPPADPDDIFRIDDH